MWARRCAAGQGAEAGAHRGSLTNDERPDEDRPLRALIASCGAARSSLWSRPAAWAARRTWPTCWPAGPTWCRPARCSCAARERRARRPEGRAGDECRPPGQPGSPGPSADAGRANSSTPWCGQHPGAPAAYPEINNAHASAAGQGGPAPATPST